MRFGIGTLGWIAFAPFLVVLHERASLKRHLIVLAALVVGWLAAIPVPLFAIPIACSYFVAIACGSLVHRRLGARRGAYVFAAMAVVMGWLQYAFTPGASWGILAHTQIDNLPLIQLASLTGVGGITFLVALGSGLAAAAWRGSVRPLRTDLIVFGLVVVAVHVYGEVRLGQDARSSTIKVGSVVSPVASRGQSFAKQHGVMLLMAYGIADSMKPFHYINKYRVYLPTGEMADEYIKRHPVPGDPNDPGQAHARDGADVALVPASDWRGIDPQHGRMAIMNAVATGLPMVRPVRAARSFATDQYGRTLASMDAQDADGVFVVSLPAARVWTLYGTTGEVVPLLALGFGVSMTLLAFTRRATA